MLSRFTMERCLSHNFPLLPPWHSICPMLEFCTVSCGSHGKNLWETIFESHEMLGGEGHSRVVSGTVAGQVGAGQGYFSFWNGHTHTSFWAKDERDKHATSESLESGCWGVLNHHSDVTVSASASNCSLCCRCLRQRVRDVPQLQEYKQLQICFVMIKNNHKNHVLKYVMIKKNNKSLELASKRKWDLKEELSLGRETWTGRRNILGDDRMWDVGNRVHAGLKFSRKGEWE